jgi:predicted lactoylglutathione lyase
LVEPPPNELVSRSPFAALSLIGTLVTSIKGFAKFNSERIYDTAKGRDAVISLERNSKGEVVITTIKFVKRAP